jgi:hypothetical protein
MSDITTDPNNLNAAKTALAGLTDVYQQGGLNDSDKAALGEIQDQEAQAEKGSRGAIMQNMAERGVGGSGMELAAQLENQQGAATRKATADRDVAGSAQARALQAMQAAGGLGQSLQGQEFGQKAQVATAQDAINRFNTQNSQDVQNKIIADKNAAAAANLAAKQGVANTNVNLGNEQEVANKGLIQGNFNNQMNLAGAKGGIYNNIAGIQQGQQKSKDAFTGSLIGAAANVGAAAINPYGAVKKLIPGQAKGGRIPGIPRTPGDSEMNDTIPAKLSPGEIVVPRTIARNPERAAEFVKHPPMAKSSINPEVLKMIMRKHAPAKLAAGGMLDLNQTPADELNQNIDPNIEAIMRSMDTYNEDTPAQPEIAPAPAPAPAPMPISPGQGPAPEPAPIGTDDPTSPEARQAMLANMGKPNVGQLIAKSVGGIGDAISASVGQTGKGMSGVDSVIGAQKQGALDKFAAGREDVGYQAKIGQQKEMMDPNSDTSKIYQSFVKQMTGKDTTLPANKIADLLPITVKMYDAQQAAQARRDVGKMNADTRRDNKDFTTGLKDDQQQSRLFQQTKSGIMSIRGDTSLKNIEGQRDAAIMAYNRIGQIEKSGKGMNPVDYVDILGQVYKARTGTAPTDIVLKEARQETLKGKYGKAWTLITGQQAPATTKDIQDSLKDMVMHMGIQSDKLHEAYMKPHLVIDPRLNDTDKQTLLKEARGLSFSEATGVNPEEENKTAGWTPEKEKRLQELKAKAGK